MSLTGTVLAAGALSWLIVLGLRRWAAPLRLIDAPNERSMHSVPTPRGGGAAIVVVCVLGITAAGASGMRPAWPSLGGYLAGAALIVAASLVDDVRSLPSAIRLAVHVLAAVLMVAGLRPELSQIAPAGLLWPLVAVAIVWIVGTTNAYNFMDGIDGLAATQGIVAGIGWGILASISHQPFLELLGLLIAAGCAGFLLHNWSPARIFMGDVGSAFLGFTFAFMALAAPGRIDQFVSGVLMLWPFMFDSGFTILRRLMLRENILIAHRSHLYQRLVLAGWSTSSVTALYSLLALISATLAVVWWQTTSFADRLLVAAGVVVISAALWILVLRAESRSDQTSGASL